VLAHVHEADRRARQRVREPGRAPHTPGALGPKNIMEGEQKKTHVTRFKNIPGKFKISNLIRFKL
jgi:hypothetical protein